MDEVHFPATKYPTVAREELGDQVTRRALYANFEAALGNPDASALLDFSIIYALHFEVRFGSNECESARHLELAVQPERALVVGIRSDRGERGDEAFLRLLIYGREPIVSRDISRRGIGLTNNNRCTGARVNHGSDGLLLDQVFRHLRGRGYRPIFLGQLGHQHFFALLEREELAARIGQGCRCGSNGRHPNRLHGHRGGSGGDHFRCGLAQLNLQSLHRDHALLRQTRDGLNVDGNTGAKSHSVFGKLGRARFEVLVEILERGVSGRCLMRRDGNSPGNNGAEINL